MGLKRFSFENDEKGVSEVLGSILTLAITVILFTSVFYSVQNIQPPEEQNFTKFSYNFDICQISGNDNLFYINMTNKGGDILSDHQIKTYLIVDQNNYRFTFSDDHSGNDLSDGKWGIGDTFNIQINSSQSTLYQALNTTSQNVDILILDDIKNTIIWRESLVRTNELAPVIRDLGVDYPLQWETYVVPGNKVTLWTEIIDKDTRESIDVTVELSPIDGYKNNGYKGSSTYNMTVHSVKTLKPGISYENGIDSYEISGPGKYDALELNRYKLPIEIDSDQNNGTYLLKVNATDGEHQASGQQYIVLNIGDQPVKDEPDLRIDENKIKFNPESPQSGDEFTVTSTIYNAGNEKGTADIVFKDTLPNGTQNIVRTRYNVNFPVGGGRDISTSWSINQSGKHIITIETKNITNGDSTNKSIFVNPTILLVDDDQVKDGAVSDDTTYMKNALDSTDFSYDLVTAGPINGPSYDSGKKPLQDYDVIVWMTGSETNNTLTSTDRSNLDKIIENNKKLWLIGEGIADDAEDNGWEDWLSNRFNISSVSTDVNAPEGKLYGNGVPLNNSEEFSIRSDTYDGDYLNTVTGQASESSMLIDSENNTLATSYKGNNTYDFKTVLQSFRFNSISEKTTTGRTYIAYRIIMWLGGIKSKSGKDLALSYQEFSNRRPNYKDTINITGIVRNNGRDDEATDIILEVDGDAVNDTTMIIPGNGGSEIVQFTWTANEVGRHTIKIVVDPFNKIRETNEINNDITYQGVNVTVVVRFTTLIVDDDGGTDSAEIVMESYDRLGYAYDSVIVSNTETGPSLDKMSFYNSLCWVTGSDTDDTLTISDMRNIRNFLYNYSSNFIMIGDGLLEDLSPFNSTEKSYVKNIFNIDANSTSFIAPEPEKLHGINNDPITHGMEYVLKEGYNGYSYSYDLISGSYIFKDSRGNPLANRYTDKTYNFKSIHMGFNIEHFEESNIEESLYSDFVGNISRDGDAIRDEFIYMVNHWFGNQDERIELRVSEPDIEIDNAHPMLGRSYRLRVEVENVGYKGTNALVRFKDGDSHIDTESLYVPANGISDVETKWIPLHAGPSRPIRVLVDPVGEVAEIPNEPNSESFTQELMGFNNQAIKHTPVYYFWDNMENGSSKWRHESNLALINGESPINYLGEGYYNDTDTNVAGTWDKTNNVSRVNWSSHSNPNSFFMEEPIGKTVARKTDAIVAIVIDNSPSMTDRTNSTGATWLEVAKEAAVSMVDSLSNESYVGIYDFKGSLENRVLGITSLEGNGRDTVVNSIRNGVSSSGNTNTVIWDTIGMGYMDVNSFASSHPDLQTAVVTLSDGADYQAADSSAYKQQSLEAGSDEWCPWGNMQPENNYPTQNYPNHWGKYHFYKNPLPGEWKNAGTYGGAYVSERKGLLNSNIPIFTVGLALEHYSPPDGNPRNTYPTDGETDYKTHIEGTESGTVEYNLWRVATTSNAEYFYAPNPDDLSDIFIEISQLIQKPENLSSINSIEVSSSDSLNPNPREAENEDKWAETPTFNLKNMSSTWLTFWHRYKILQGVNGAFIQVGMYNETSGEWMWKYITPSIGPYTGNLLLDQLPEDDFGNEIRWCWNGKSGSGTLSWDYVKINLLNHIPSDELSDVRVRFYYKQYGGSSDGGGWLIDDVNIIASRQGDSSSNIGPDMQDVWRLTDYSSHSGDTAWWNGEGDPSTGYFKGGIDNRLITTPIDLTNAKTAELSAYFKFNINTKDGRPPDGFRVEISTNNGVSWEAINIGSRTTSGVADWIAAENLYRLNVDLSDFSGNAILLRFRVVTNNVQNHYEVQGADGGFYVDDVIISGETIQG